MVVTDVVVVAAGRGERAGGGVPKQYRALGGRSVLRRTLELFAAHPEIRRVLPVIHGDDSALAAAACADLPGVAAPVAGGASRQASVRAGLEALGDDPPDLVLIHDAARPFASPALVDRAIAAALRFGAAVPALPVTDTLKALDEQGYAVAGPDRAGLRTVQTPQAFGFPLIRAAHAAVASRSDLTDDAAVAEAAGHKVALFDGEPANIKLTTAEDFVMAERQSFAALADVRTATGFDVHAFAPGDHVMLGGVAIPHSAGLAGHSDADVVLHALTDAVLGAIGAADIGHHFPPSDPAWKGASSDRFLAHAVTLVAAAGGRIAHLDATVICEAPKIGPHRETMRARIAQIAGLPVARVSVKATTSEQLGFTGRREGIAALAGATVRLPFTDDAP
ncbi:MAG TPA: bifunctional 2-C-methyl-D-erythritol 4-phosphate cytidylyltransferase/2-C-methyl-D-erythritol 2,4-cyclodiphosphate synthase [Xanthobacteraceae bacterium]|nr:bifunctional 2-C-methyl-D-erythritol 4-phosphate cytidylyltransferase/2-C-methyl-D-erythritol 2,4-cyclodiphosphate synthase [Xanthobacteraceae bacterium]